MTSRGAALVVVFALAAVARGDPPGRIVDAARRRADEVATSLTAGLYTELSRAMAGGPTGAAVGVCGDVAQRLTAEIAAHEQVAVRRTALRVRNPANAPDEYERRVLEQWGRPGGRAVAAAEVMPTAAGGFELRYLRPIVLQPLCVACHGPAETIPDAIRAVLRERYPDDRAIGFRPGDVRGAVSVRISLPME